MWVRRVWSGTPQERLTRSVCFLMGQCFCKLLTWCCIWTDQDHRLLKSQTFANVFPWPPCSGHFPCDFISLCTKNKSHILKKERIKSHCIVCCFKMPDMVWVFVASLPSHVEILTFKANVLGDEVWGGHYVMKTHAIWTGLVSHLRGLRQSPSDFLPAEDIMKEKLSSMKQEEGHCQTSNLPVS